MTTTKRGPLALLHDYFGRHPGQSYPEFAAELNELSDDEKLELARLAAIELGLGEAQLAFSLKPGSAAA